MTERRILRLEHGEISVAREARFASESDLESAISAHPEVLPSEDLGLGPLVTLANQLDRGAGPLDLLAVDGQGRLVIVEFKRGTENPDVRQVVAQVLDYGASLWQLDYDELEERCARCEPGLAGSLAEHVESRLAELDVAGFDEEAFRRGVATCLDAGDFVFLYVGRDMDRRTRRIMTYLAEGPRMTFFAVEIDYFHGGDHSTSVLVPRTAFIPSWVNAPVQGGRSRSAAKATLEQAPEPARLLLDQMNEFARERGLIVTAAKTGFAYRPHKGRSGVGVYFLSDPRVEFCLKAFRTRDDDEFADRFLTKLCEVSRVNVTAAEWPAVPIETLAHDWDRTRRELMEPYFEARLAHFTESPEGD